MVDMVADTLETGVDMAGTYTEVELVLILEQVVELGLALAMLLVVVLLVVVPVH